MAGLQGSGKTTHVGKLAQYLRNIEFKTVDGGGEIYRPAAINNCYHRKQNSILMFSNWEIMHKPELSLNVLCNMPRKNYNLILIDTADPASTKI